MIPCRFGRLTAPHGGFASRVADDGCISIISCILVAPIKHDRCAAVRQFRLRAAALVGTLPCGQAAWRIDRFC